MTVGEQMFMEVVQHNLRKIAAELERANRLEEFRLRREIGAYSPLNEIDHKELTEIMGKDHR